ncbi:hypothetical protein PR048_017373 [Dryococelus australis]|uniref:Uncharacterized protein n=1 Tax=Dryococelus australis TaxID=614101 RepID=A0ABQ9H9I8_9NEOP|nr:hypothetical protein PR048_017373 [Dryococelus australis]
MAHLLYVAVSSYYTFAASQRETRKIAPDRVITSAVKVGQLAPDLVQEILLQVRSPDYESERDLYFRVSKENKYHVSSAQRGSGSSLYPATPTADVQYEGFVVTKDAGGGMSGLLSCRRCGPYLATPRQSIDQFVVPCPPPSPRTVPVWKTVPQIPPGHLVIPGDQGVPLKEQGLGERRVIEQPLRRILSANDGYYRVCARYFCLAAVETTIASPDSCKADPAFLKSTFASVGRQSNAESNPVIEVRPHTGSCIRSYLELSSAFEADRRRSNKGDIALHIKYAIAANRKALNRRATRMERRWNARAGKREYPEKTHRQAASSSTIPTCENLGVTRSGIEPGLSWETRRLTARPRGH